MRVIPMHSLRTFLLIAAAMVLMPVARAESFRIVANNDVHVSTLTKKEVSDLFMKKTSRWQNGTSVVPVDQQSGNVREEFSKTVYGKPAAAVKSYWNQQIFSGRDVPPVEKLSDAEVLSFVRATPGAVGYVSDGVPTSGVHVIPIQ